MRPEDAAGPKVPRNSHGTRPLATVTDLRRDRDLREEIQAAVDDANKAVSHAEAIKRFAILTEGFTEAGGQLTPTQKVRRNIVMQQYATLIAALYEDRPA